VLTKTAPYQEDNQCPIDCEDNRLNSDQLLCHTVLTPDNGSGIDTASRSIPYCTLHTRHICCEF